MSAQGFGMSGLTIASHVTLIVIVSMLAWRAMRHMDPGLRAAISIACIALIIERSYYILARFLYASGVDLWRMHPAPEVLSLIVATGLYAIMIPILIYRYGLSRGWSRISVEAAGLLLFWAALAWVLY